MSKEIELHELRCPNCKALWSDKDFRFWGVRAYMTWKCPYCRTLFCTEGTKDAKDQRMAEMEAFLEGFSVKTGITTNSTSWPPLGMTSHYTERRPGGII